jgi:hypothetical protein
MRYKITEFVGNALTFLILVSVLFFVMQNIYYTYSTIRFQQNMILALQYKCSWYIKDEDDKDFQER